ncbi:MAG: ATP-binding protein [Phycisphaerae bacterium]|nr:ATP-binding protein [Phycisphaerae bacterium]
MTESSDKVVYMMRGLPSCGKSTTARKLAGERGLVLETDQYFYTEVGEDPTRFNYKAELMEDARQWNFERFKQAVREGQRLIVVDRGNSLNLESHVYARFAADRGYTVRLTEPDSPWWQELKVLLKYKQVTKPVLEKWALQLYKLSRRTHRVPISTIRRWMFRWKWNVTIEDILAYKPRNDEEDELFRTYMEDDLGEPAPPKPDPVPDSTESV